MKIAVFYHALFTHGNPREFRPGAFCIVEEAMAAIEKTGLLAAAQEVVFCFNGPEEDRQYADLLAPVQAKVICHGPNSFAENLTIVELWKFCQAHPNWAVLYFHAKGATHDPESGYARGVSTPWRQTMLSYMVGAWQNAVDDIGRGADVVCCHWLWNMADGTQHIPAGNFLWVSSNFAGSLPSFDQRDRIKSDGIAAAASRYEAEVFWGNGRRPIVVQYLPSGGGGVP